MMVRPVAMSREKSERAAWVTRSPAPTIKMYAKVTPRCADEAHFGPDAGENHVRRELGHGAQGGVESEPRAAEASRAETEPPLAQLPAPDIGMSGRGPRILPLGNPEMNLVEVPGRV